MFMFSRLEYSKVFSCTLHLRVSLLVGIILPLIRGEGHSFLIPAQYLFKVSDCDSSCVFNRLKQVRISLFCCLPIDPSRPKGTPVRLSCDLLVSRTLEVLIPFSNMLPRNSYIQIFGNQNFNPILSNRITTMSF